MEMDENVNSSSGRGSSLSSQVVRCFKCSQVLMPFQVIRKENHQQDGVAGDPSKYFINLEDWPGFIEEQVEATKWTKGKLRCPSCQYTIGAFNFITKDQISGEGSCLPRVALHSKKIDILHRSPKKKLPESFQAAETQCQIPVQVQNITHLPQLHEDFRSEEGNMSASRFPSNLICENVDANTDDTDEVSAACCSPFSTSDNVNQNDLNPHPPSPFLRKCSSKSIVFKSTSNSSLSRPTGSLQLPMEGSAVETAEKEVGVQGDVAEARNGDSIMHSDGTEISIDNRFDGLLHVPKNLNMKRQRREEKARKKKIAFERKQRLIEIEQKAFDEAMSDNTDMCPVCYELLYRPHTLVPCGHVFCVGCLWGLQRHLSYSSTAQCPMCRVPIERCVFSGDHDQRIRERYYMMYKSRKAVVEKYRTKSDALPRRTFRRPLPRLQDNWFLRHRMTIHWMLIVIFVTLLRSRFFHGFILFIVLWKLVF